MRPASLLARIGQAGVAASLVVAFGLVALTPGRVAEAAFTPPVPTLAMAARDRLAVIEQTRDDLASVAAAVLAQADVTRLDAVAAQVPADQLAALLALSVRVDELNRQVGSGATVRSSYLIQLTPADLLTLDGTTTTTAGAAPAIVAAADGAAATDVVVTVAPEPAVTVAPEPAATVAPEPAATAEGHRAADPSEEAPLAVAGAVSPAFIDLSAATRTIDAKDLAAVLAAVPSVLVNDDAAAAALRDGVVALAAAAADVSVVAETNRTAAETAAAQAAQEAALKAADDAAAAAATAEAARRKALPRSAKGYVNGEIPASTLCHPSSNRSVLLRCDAAKAFGEMDAAYVAEFGSHLVVSDSYRSYPEQIRCRAEKGSMCADPGTSNHGWGLAIDFADGAHRFGTPAHVWLEANAGTYGWTPPSWARRGGGREEPWHWEYGV